MEEKILTFECLECGFRSTFTNRRARVMDGKRCDKCKGLITITKTKSGEKPSTANRRDKDMIEKSNDCNSCTDFKYDRANRKWVCSKCNKDK